MLVSLVQFCGLYREFFILIEKIDPFFNTKLNFKNYKFYKIKLVNKPTQQYIQFNFLGIKFLSI